MSAKFDDFARLHVPGNPLVLYNCWDAGSAQAAVRGGAKAIATGSWSVAASYGLSDAEALPIDLALANARRIAEAVALPVTIDFEGGYATEPAAFAANIEKLAGIGAIGCNIEDQVIGGAGIHPIAGHAARIAAARDAVGPDFFINARTDIFLQAPPAEHDDATVDAALDRARAYADAGASGFFVPGLADLRLLARVCEASPLPVNVMAFPGTPARAAFAEVGVARISHGPFPYRLALAAYEDALRLAMA